MAKKTDLKVRKKRWIQIVSPAFNEQVIGETSVYELNDAVGKSLRINLMNLTGDPRKQNDRVMFVTDKVKGETAVLAALTGFTMQAPAMKKLVRRGKTKVADSFKCYTADKKPIIVKPFVVTRNLVNNAIQARIRWMIRKLTVEKLAKQNFEDFMKEVVAHSIQKEMQGAVSKIYPLKAFEYYAIKIVPEKGKFYTVDDVKQDVVETEEPEEDETEK